MDTLTDSATSAATGPETGLDFMIYVVIALFLMSVLTEKFVTLIRKYPKQAQISTIISALLFAIISLRSLSVNFYGAVLILIICIWLGGAAVHEFTRQYFSYKHGLITKFISWSNPFKNTAKKLENASLEEKAREMSLLSFLIGFVIAALFDASFFEVFAEEPGKFPGDFDWGNSDILKDIKDLRFSFKISPEFRYMDLIGYLLTGFFLSFGSKFFHDLLDRLYEAKRIKKAMADANTYTLDNTAAVASLVTTYESEFIKSAYSEAKPMLMANDSVQAISLNRDQSGYFIELVVDSSGSSIQDSYSYIMNDGRIVNIPIRKDILDSEDIEAQSLGLDSRIFENSNPSNWGTLGCFVKKTDVNDSRVYLLTCGHNLVQKGNALNLGQLVPTTKLNGRAIGKVEDLIIDNSMDVALIQLDLSQIRSPVFNKVIGAPKGSSTFGVRSINSSDRNKRAAWLYGAKSFSQNGFVTGVYCDVKLRYVQNQPKHLLQSLIVIRSNGKSISQGGDSGSLVVDGEGYTLGLLVGGYSKASYVIPLDRMLNKFQVKLI